MSVEEKLENIKALTDSIQPHKISVLTGRNGSGKSLVRKLLGFYMADKMGKDSPNGVVSGVSMQSRTEKKHDFGALSALGIDNPENPTGLETIDNNLVPLFNSLKQGSRYLVIDEPEIGSGEELVAAMVNWLNETLPTLDHWGVLIITHNRYIVEHLNYNHFFNMEGLTKDEWLNRKIEPVSLEAFRNDSLELWRHIASKLK